jgi:hypothetical protein
MGQLLDEGFDGREVCDVEPNRRLHVALLDALSERC